MKDLYGTGGTVVGAGVYLGDTTGTENRTAGVYTKEIEREEERKNGEIERERYENGGRGCDEYVF